ncbi:hypothetical protein [Methylobacterium sp. 22177]|jgi:hypothetical protein|uniref:hypothetical protein n=1 Tax=Methylobacterium sp. 22177 TaxID=3453885 RepID=UPI000467E2C6
MNRMLPWRWTAEPLRCGGMHGSIAIFFPLLIFTGLSRYTFMALGIYAVFLFYCARKKLTPQQMVKYWHTKFIEGGKWPSF